MLQVLPQPPPVCQPPVALPAPSGKGAMLVDAASGRLEWVQPSGAHLFLYCPTHHAAASILMWLSTHPVLADTC